MFFEVILQVSENCSYQLMTDDSSFILQNFLGYLTYINMRIVFLWIVSHTTDKDFHIGSLQLSLTENAWGTLLDIRKMKIMKKVNL